MLPHQVTTSHVLENTDPTVAVGEVFGPVTLPAFIQPIGVSRHTGMEALCLTGLCWVEGGRVRLQRVYVKAELGLRLRNAQGYPYDLLSPEGVEYARSRWSECLASVERWYRRERGGRIERASESVGHAPSTASLADRVALLKKKHPELTQKEIAQAMGVSLRTVERCSAVVRKRSRVVGRADSYKALEPATKYTVSVASTLQAAPSRSSDPDYDPAEDIVHDAFRDGTPCVVPREPAPPRPPSGRYDALRPTLFIAPPDATVQEAWRALEALRAQRHGGTCATMELRFIFDHFPATLPAKAVARMVGVSVSTARRHRAKWRGSKGA